MARLILVTGCSGGGKSTLVDHLRSLGHAVVDEPGRRIVAEELAGRGDALPWVNPRAFARRAQAMARADLDRSRSARGLVFFDRGLLDAAVALRHLDGTPLDQSLGPDFPYDAPVFVAPPWPDLFQSDDARRHDLTEALAEYDRIAAALVELSIPTVCLPKTSPGDRAALVLSLLAQAG